MLPLLLHQRSSLVLLLLFFSAHHASAACGYGTIIQPRNDSGAIKISTFGYIGGKGPANWASLEAPTNALCATGSNQSPIDLVAESSIIVPKGQISISMPNLPQGADFENLGSTIQVVANNSGAAFSLNGTQYGLEQFHFHLPSEHLDSGIRTVMELHSVWQAPGGKIAVVAAFIDTGPQNNASAPRPPFRRDACNNTQSDNGTSGASTTTCDNVQVANIDVQQPASALIDTVLGFADKIVTPGTKTRTTPLAMSDLANIFNSGQFRTYQGSLTTPPCTEGITWLVSDQRIIIQEDMFHRARSVLGFNARFPQNFPGQPNVLAMKPL